MSILKHKKLGLSVALTVAVLSLALVLLLPTVADTQTTYYSVTLQANDSARGTVSAMDDNGTVGTSFPAGTPVTITATAKPGYQFVKWEGTPILTQQTHRIPSLDGNRNYTAVFEPITYNIIYEGEGLEFDTEPPRVHTYGYPTKLPVTSASSAHKLVGWEIESNGNVTSTRDLVNGTLGAHDYHADITLRPIFEGNLFDVTCYDLTESGKELGRVVEQYAYGTSTIPISEWEVKNYNGYEFKSYQDLQASVIVDAERNKVYRIYKAKSYNVTFDNNGGTGGKTGLEGVVFDQKFPEIAEADYPTRDGYTFIGYYYHDDKGTQIPYFYCDAVTRVVEREVWNIPENATLHAHWNKNDYKLSFSGDWLDRVTSITVKGLDESNQEKIFDYQTELIPYNTKLTITVNVDDTHKLVKWNGETIGHVDTGVFELTIKEDTVISDCVTLSELAAPTFKVDYAKETFVYDGGVIPAGKYRLEKDGVVLLSMTVDADGNMTFADRTQTLSATAYLGSTVQWIRCGDGTVTSDSDGQSIAIAARPTAPIRNTDYSGASNSENRTIIMKFPSGVDTSVFEFAYRANEEDELIWQSDPVLRELNAGTPYFVYIRVAATETAPCSDAVYVEKVETLSDDFLQNCIDEIMKLREPTDGENVKKLLADAKLEMENMTKAEHTETYEADMLAIVARVEAEIPHARKQDKAIADLTVRYNELTQSGAYSETLGLPALKSIYDTAVTKINAEDSDSLVDQIYADTLVQFDAVPISYLYVGDDMRLTVSKGMDKDYKLAMSRVGDLTTITAQIQRAINAGTIVPGGVQMTYTDLRDALKTLDVLGYYQLRLTHKNVASVVNRADGPYEMRLLLPEDLRSDTGFMVAYYDAANEELTVLETTREGNYITFKAPQSVKDFVILGDHAVNLVGICIALSVALLAQIIAIWIILVRRRKNKQTMRLNSFAIPVFALTVRFYPVSVTKAVVILAALVLILQFILMWLLVKTDVIPRRRRRRHHHAVPKPTVEEQPRVAEEESVLEEDLPTEDVIVEEEAFEETFEEVFEEEATDGEAAETFSDAEDEIFVETQEQDWYGEDEFIEPAPNPNYSLPEDYESSEELVSEDEFSEQDPNGYRLEYDDEGNAYTLEYDNESDQYVDENFDGEDGKAYDGEETEYDQYYESNAEQVDYGYDEDRSEDQTEVVYDYVSAEDVIRDEDAYEEVYEEAFDERFEQSVDAEYDGDSSYDALPEDTLPNE